MKKNNKKKLKELRNLLSFFETRKDEEQVNRIRKEILELDEDNDLESMNKIF